MLAELNFLRPMAAEPILDISGGGRTNLKLVSREVEIADADSQSPPPSLASHGFAAVPFSATPPEGAADRDYRQQFAQLCATAVKAETGAAMAIGIAKSVQVRRSKAVDHESPISVCHTDFTPASAVRRIAQLAHPGAGEKLKLPRRFAAFNAWWLGRPGPQDRPLALCDATSIAAADLRLGSADVVAPDGTPTDYGEMAFQRYNPRHRWFWYPQLGPDRLLLFCGFDSDASKPSMVTHSAFTNPDCPPAAPPRLSVECRCFAFW